ncbi:MAG: carbohydrate porin [Ignavibacteria bacterium]|nr:carbohydrate porin [Ignavibacteria bacterium]
MERVLLLLLLFVGAGFLQAEGDDTSSVQYDDCLTGNWNGSRGLLSAKGLDFSTMLINDFFLVKSFTGSGYLLNYANVNLDIDFEKAGIANGLEGKIQCIGVHSNHAVFDGGTAQGLSNIAAENLFKIYQLWLQYELVPDILDTKLGIYDLNSEFDSRPASGMFLNPSHGIGVDISQSGEAGPSIFPYTAYTLRVKYRPWKNVKILGAVTDAVPGTGSSYSTPVPRFSRADGYLLISEAMYSTSDERLTEAYQKYSVGGWYYTAPVESINSETNFCNKGIYLFMERYLGKPPLNIADEIYCTARLGAANARVNDIAHFCTLCFTFHGLGNNTEDWLGVGFAYAHIGSDYLNSNPGLTGDHELIFECTYSAPVWHGITLQPDVQYIQFPVEDPGPHFLAAGMRLILQL